MSAKKFDSLVSKMVKNTKHAQWDLAKDIGALLRIVYSELISMKSDIKSLQNKECQKCSQRKSDVAEFQRMREEIVSHLKDWRDKFDDPNIPIVGFGDKNLSPNDIVAEIEQETSRGERLLTYWMALSQKKYE